MPPGKAAMANLLEEQALRLGTVMCGRIDRLEHTYIISMVERERSSERCNPCIKYTHE